MVMIDDRDEDHDDDDGGDRGDFVMRVDKFIDQTNKLQKFEAVSNYGSATDHITSRMWFRIFFFYRIFNLNYRGGRLLTGILK